MKDKKIHTKTTVPGNGLQAGNDAVFTEVYGLYYKPLFYYAQQFMSPQRAEDILADSFLKLYRSGKQFETLEHIHHWLRMTVHHACLNSLRGEVRREQREAGWQEAAASAIGPPEAQAFLEAEIEVQLFSRILSALRALPERQRSILSKCFLEGMDNEQVAAALGISLQTVKNQKVTALKALRRQFGRDELLLIGCLLFFPS